MKSCEQTDARLTAYLCGELPPADEAAMREHLEQCEACQLAFLHLQESYAGLQEEAGSVPEPAPLRHDQRQAILQHAAAAEKGPIVMRPTPRRGPRLVLKLAAMLMMVAGGWLLISPAIFPERTTRLEGQPDVAAPAPSEMPVTQSKSTTSGAPPALADDAAADDASTIRGAAETDNLPLVGETVEEEAADEFSEMTDEASREPALDAIALAPAPSAAPPVAIDEPLRSLETKGRGAAGDVTYSRQRQQVRTNRSPAAAREAVDLSPADELAELKLSREPAPPGITPPAAEAPAIGDLADQLAFTFGDATHAGNLSAAEATASRATRQLAGGSSVTTHLVHSPLQPQAVLLVAELAVPEAGRLQIQTVFSPAEVISQRRLLQRQPAELQALIVYEFVPRGSLRQPASLQLQRDGVSQTLRLSGEVQSWKQASPAIKQTILRAYGSEAALQPALRQRLDLLRQELHQNNGTR